MRGRVGHRELSAPVFAAHAPADLAALELLRNQLRPVTDAQDRDTEFVDSRIQRWGAIDVNALGASRQNDRSGLTTDDFFGSNAVGHYFAIHVELTHAARNELRVLGTKVNDKDGFDTVGQDPESSPRWANTPITRDDGSMRRWFLLTLTVLAVLAPAPALAVGPPDSGVTTDTAVTATSIDNEFLNTKRDISECLGNSVNLPDCGVKPTTPGARGGALQYVTFALMAFGLGFIFWRVTRGVRARDSAVDPTKP